MPRKAVAHKTSYQMSRAWEYGEIHLLALQKGER